MNPMSELVELIFHPIWYLKGTVLMGLCLGALLAVVGTVRLIASIFKSENPET
jgi:hypothetical protein